MHEERLVAAPVGGPPPSWHRCAAQQLQRAAEGGGGPFHTLSLVPVLHHRLENTRGLPYCRKQASVGEEDVVLFWGPGPPSLSQQNAQLHPLKLVDRLLAGTWHVRDA